MAAIVLSLVYRHIQHLTDVLRCLEVEGLIPLTPIDFIGRPERCDYTLQALRPS
ncbi:MAG: hypothetical protein KME52_26745 [Desmonostoc geniculatum HA4340-LM1]|jgi:hypothetical protein|nr:hypothetical protein [Desmonostoc geniculatum HA4340-LM1]